MILMDFEGMIKGDSQNSEFTDWITVDSVQMGVGRAISSSGSGADRDTSTPSFSEVTISKSTDIASTELFAQATYGKKICEKAIIKWVQTAGAGATQVYMELELGDPIISSYSVSSGGERPVESVSINFISVVMRYTQFTEGGEATEADPKGYDLKAGTEFAG